MAVGMLLLLVWQAIAWWHPVYRWRLPSDRLTADGGLAYHFEGLPTPWGVGPSDDVGHFEVSRLDLLEDGVALGPAHAAHPQIRETGGGRFSHWHGELWLSTRDGSDPRTNGRHYSIEVPQRLDERWAWLGTGLVLLAICRGALRWLGRTRAPEWLPRAVGATMLATGVMAVATLTWLSRRERCIEQQLPTELTQPCGAPSTTPGDRHLRTLDLFGSQIAWNIPSFFVGNWPRCEAQSARLRLSIDGQAAQAATSLDEMTTAAGEPAFTARLGQALVVCAPHSVSQQPWVLGVPIVPSRGAFYIAWLITATGAWLLHSGRWVALHRLTVTLRQLGALALAPLAVALLAMNLWGNLTHPLRAPFDQAKLAAGYGPNDRPLQWTETRELIARGPDESPANYVRRATRLVSDTVGHAWDRRFVTELRMQVPIAENWLLWLYGELDPAGREYFFVDWRRAIERGIGLCGHVAYALSEVLHEAGLEARVVQLVGHTVVTVAVDAQTWWIADPDLGFVIPACLEDLQRDPARTEAAYAAALLRFDREDPAEAAAFAKLYASGDNLVAPTAEDPSVTEASRRFEQLAYALRWPLPAAALVPWLLLRRRPRRARQRARADTTTVLGIAAALP